ncbi:TspO/MBR family protein [Aspergillus clavatus NRRL 1]|uniref:Benzodiazepine receptor family protein n=1 Tax=Aspergillus clavatus (strain ATCC 1007 / CBS 513.65 / DSM 816 / NCTC 3887 / NRRL 1 / QM 1276 / 107) TaxID=344612 RepID=A1CCS7_ASPCL|nr:benzodiazepine receptor family protein [Aspergillus clavatus NRRL 1]EAW12334.1 benzodiazepine receptor family protein [Aspergillus clavatus NRRL 1]
MPWSFTFPQEVFTSPILAVATPITVGSLVGYLVNRKGHTKQLYGRLRQPPLRPPAWLFAPVWTILYGMMGYAAHHATTTATLLTPASAVVDASQTLYTSQLVLNYLWMPLFFGLRKPGWAMANMVVLGGTVGKLMEVWWNTDRTAFWLMVPYAGWLCFATYLNASVGWLNGWDFENRDGR